MSDELPSLLTTWRGTVLSEWVDYNGHLRDAFYMLLFSYATDGFMDQIGLDVAGRAASGHSLFTMEAHINYVKEVKEGVAVEVRTQVLAHDAKRLQIYHALYRSEGLSVLAANEQMLINVDVTGSDTGAFSTAFAPRVMEEIQRYMMLHGTLPCPKYAGRRIALPNSLSGWAQL